MPSLPSFPWTLISAPLMRPTASRRYLGSLMTFLLQDLESVSEIGAVTKEKDKKDGPMKTKEGRRPWFRAERRLDRVEASRKRNERSRLCTDESLPATPAAWRTTSPPGWRF